MRQQREESHYLMLLGKNWLSRLDMQALSCSDARKIGIIAENLPRSLFFFCNCIIRTSGRRRKKIEAHTRSESLIFKPWHLQRWMIVKRENDILVESPVKKLPRLDASIISVDGQVEKLVYVPAEARKTEIKINGI